MRNFRHRRQASSWKRGRLRRMSARKRETLAPTEVLGARPEWPKEPKPWAGEIRLTLLSKKEGVDSLMDLGVADETLNAAILHGIQQAAFRLDLQKKGFEVRAHVYPPLQHRPELAFKIRAGKPPKKPAAEKTP
jgi:hypothetical protein